MLLHVLWASFAFSVKVVVVHVQEGRLAKAGFFCAQTDQCSPGLENELDRRLPHVFVDQVPLLRAAPPQSSARGTSPLSIHL